MKQLAPFIKSLSVFSNFFKVISIGLSVFLTSSFSYSQPIMTNMEGFYFTLKANNFKITDNAIEGPQLQVRWFDIYVNTFDKTNYQNYRNDEFKWPQYSKKIVEEINNGIASADFSKIYSLTCNATFGKWDSESSSFPITELWSGIEIVKYSLAFNDFTVRYSPTWGNKDIEYKLKMDPLKAERLIESRKDNIGNINRKITAKVIFNVVNRSLERTLTQVNLEVYMHKIFFMDGTTVLGEISPIAKYSSSVESDPSFVKVDQIPEFPGGEHALMKFVSDNLRVPNNATAYCQKLGLGNSILVRNQGQINQENPINSKNNYAVTVILNFVIDKDGKITQPKVIRGIGGEFDDEALRVLKMMPTWKPGKQGGKSVPVFYSLPFKFIWQ
jgi:hypothetical protein